FCCNRSRTRCGRASSGSARVRRASRRARTGKHSVTPWEHTVKLQHHIGGIENLGPVSLDTRVFAESWEKRIFGIHTTMMAESAHLADALHAYPVRELPTGFKSNWTWASLRTGAEGMQPFDYFKYRYYEKWLGGIAQFFVDAGYISAAELDEKSA